jgi:hypothetical protein
MRRLDETPLDPEVVASLEAIDATLAGDPVDPKHAELAELALLLAADRPDLTTAFTSALDERVRRRFAAVEPVDARKRKRSRRWWVWTPAAGFAAALLAAIVIVIGTNPGGGPSAGPSMNAASPPQKLQAPAAHGPGAPTRTGSAASKAAQPHAAESLAENGAAASGAAATAAPVLQPPANGRRIIQGAQLSLTTASGRIDAVAQELFVVVGQVHGIVNSSQVTATGGPGGYAQFQLSIPSGSMPQAMAALSSMRYARVSSRTDTTQDVNNQYQSDVQQLADARARRAALLQMLAKATTQGQIDSLTVKLHDTEAEISSDQATLARLNNQIAYSQVSVTINGGIVPIPVHTGGGGGFSLHQAIHDAGRVLTVAAGVALIALAALTPLALLGLLAWWIASAVRRRRREQALDLV